MPSSIHLTEKTLKIMPNPVAKRQSQKKEQRKRIRINPVIGYSTLVPLEEQLESIRKYQAQHKGNPVPKNQHNQKTIIRKMNTPHDQQPPEKRRLTVSQYRSRKRDQASTLLTCLLLLLLVKLGKCAYNITYPQPGLYIEQVGEAKIRRGTLRVEINYPLNMTADIIRINKTVTQMTEVCEKSRQHAEELHCDILLHHLQEKERAIMRDMDILSTTRAKRTKRGLLGNVLQSVFGVNDEVYTDLSAIKENQQALIQASQHHTALMLSTVAQVRDTEIQTNQKINAFAGKLNNALSELNKVTGWFTSIDINRVNIHLLAAYQIAIGLLEEFEIQYKTYIKATLHRGTLLDFLSSGELALLLQDASSKIPPVLTIFDEPEDRIDTSLNDTHIKILGYLHITDANVYDVLKITPVPKRLQNDTFVIPDIRHSIIATDYNSQTYFELSETDLRRCLQKGKHLFLCVPNVISRIENNPNCIIDEIYNRHDKHQCAIRKIKVPQILFKHLLKANTWLFIANAPTHAAITCGGIHHDVTFNNTGIIQINQGCIIKTRRNILASEIMDTIGVKATFNKPLDFDISQAKPTNNTPSPQFEAETILQTSDHFSTIIHEEETLQRTLKAHPWKTIATHVTTGVITLMITAIIGIGCYRYLKRKHIMTISKPITDPPQPAERTLQCKNVQSPISKQQPTYNLRRLSVPSVTSVTEAEDVHA